LNNAIKRVFDVEHDTTQKSDKVVRSLIFLVNAVSKLYTHFHLVLLYLL